MSAPRMWRCFFLVVWYEEIDVGLLHACGDVSKTAEASSWDESVCSTHVEMFPGRTTTTTSSAGLLHACGDVSLLMSSELYCE